MDTNGSSSTKKSSDRSLQEVDPRTLREWIDSDHDCALIDVREPDEYASEKIPGSRNEPLSTWNDRPLEISPDQRTVVLCRTGERSRRAARWITASNRNRSAFVLEGGLASWKREGFDVKRSGNVSILRQVRMVAGALILGGTLLGVGASPWFFVVPGFVGAGLLYAGVTDTCGMALLLSKMPWNGS